MDPVIQAGQIGEDDQYVIAWDEDWAGTRAEVDKRWKVIDMSEGLHRTGSKGIDENGNPIDPGTSAPYRRWSAWHNDHQDEVSKVVGGEMHFGAKIVNTPDPTRTQFVRGGITYRPDLSRIYLAFRVTQDRVWSNSANNGAGGHIEDPNMEARTFGPGHHFEFEADFSGMTVPGIRFSAYLLPAVPNESNAYDDNAANGIENDWPEFDPTPGFLNHLQAKVISGAAAGNTPDGSVDLSAKIGRSDIQVGKRVYGLRWTTKHFIWYYDGIEYQRDDAVDAEGLPERVPQVPHYIVLSRECNSGISESEAVPPYIPRDDGIYGANANVWASSEAAINADVAKISYFRVWAILQATFEDTFTFRVQHTKAQHVGGPYDVQCIVTANPQGYPYRFEFSIDSAKVPVGVNVSIESISTNQINVHTDAPLDVQDILQIEAIQDGPAA